MEGLATLRQKKSPERFSSASYRVARASGSNSVMKNGVPSPTEVHYFFCCNPVYLSQKLICEKNDELSHGL